MNNVTNTSQITGHVQGSIVLSIARLKESQKVKQRVVSRMQGIYNVHQHPVNVSTSLPDIPRSILGDRDAF